MCFSFIYFLFHSFCSNISLLLSETNAHVCVYIRMSIVVNRKEVIRDTTRNIKKRMQTVFDSYMEVPTSQDGKRPRPALLAESWLTDELDLEGTIGYEVNSNVITRAWWRFDYSEWENAVKLVDEAEVELKKRGFAFTPSYVSRTKAESKEAVAPVDIKTMVTVDEEETLEMVEEVDLKPRNFKSNRSDFKCEPVQVDSAVRPEDACGLLLSILNAHPNKTMNENALKEMVYKELVQSGKRKLNCIAYDTNVSEHTCVTLLRTYTGLKTMHEYVFINFTDVVNKMISNKELTVV